MGWTELGTDLLDNTPEPLRADLVRHEYPSTRMHDTGSPADLLVTEKSSDDLDWAYVLRPEGIEVIPLGAGHQGPLVTWNTDPQTIFPDDSDSWHHYRPEPDTRPPRATTPVASPPPATARASSARR